MKVLFAVSSEEISDMIIKKYQKDYKEIFSYKNVYYYNAIIKEIQKDKNFSSFENRPVDDYRTQKERDEYREKEKARAEYRATRKQYEKYKTALGHDFPKTFQTFEKHKKLNDDVYKGWREKVRQIDQRAKETQEIINEVLA